MERWKSKICLVLLSFSCIFLIPNSLRANLLFCGCQEWCPCYLEGIDIAIDYLYWKPCVDNLDFAASVKEGSDHLNVKYKAVHPEWESGVRIMLNGPICQGDWELAASWTFVQADTSSKLEHPHRTLVSPLIHPALFEEVDKEHGFDFKSIKGKLNLRYQDWDFVLYTPIFTCPCHYFSPYFGLAGMALDQHFDVKFRNKENKHAHDACDRIKWKGEFWGVGLKAGSYYEYRCFPCFGFFASGDVSAVAGQWDGKNSQCFRNNQPSPDIFIINEDSQCRVVTGYRVATGLFFDTSVCCYRLTWRLGYEYVDWYNVSLPRSFFGNQRNGLASHASSATTRNLAFHGLFAGLLLMF